MVHMSRKVCREAQHICLRAYYLCNTCVLHIATRNLHGIWALYGYAVVVQWWQLTRSNKNLPLFLSGAGVNELVMLASVPSCAAVPSSCKAFLANLSSCMSHTSGVSLTCASCPSERHQAFFTEFRESEWIQHSCTYVNLLSAVQQEFIAVDQKWATSQVRTVLSKSVCRVCPECTCFNKVRYCSVRKVMENSSLRLKSLVKKPFLWVGWVS